MTSFSVFEGQAASHLYLFGGATRVHLVPGSSRLDLRIGGWQVLGIEVADHWRCPRGNSNSQGSFECALCDLRPLGR